MADVLKKPETFPDAFVWDLCAYLKDNLRPPQSIPLGPILLRPLRTTDPNMSLAVVPGVWEPEAMSIGQLDPAVNCYYLEVWAMAKNHLEAAAATEHSVLARNLRRMLARDRELRTLLASNRDTYDDGFERFQQLKLVRQRFHANEIQRQFLRLSVAEIKIETETV
jgi:hypothetical protein